mgnify:CR=1 FL=1
MTRGSPLRTLVARCDCMDSHHMMQFELWTWDDGPLEIFVSVQLYPVSWPKRLWYALCYVLGRRSRYSWGHWDTGGVSPESAKALLPMLGDFIVQSAGGESGTTTSTTGTPADYRA